MSKTIIYLHGFLSSPQSLKAQQTVEYVNRYHPEINLIVPQLSNYPDRAAQLLDDLVVQHRDSLVGFIGSSMGGFLSTYLVEKYGGKAVLINPAVKPFELLRSYLGEHINPYTEQRFTLTEEHIEHLILLNTPTLAEPEKYWVLLQTGDETLDYRLAEEKYTNSKLTIEPGGDHSFQNYQRFLPEILTFLS